MDDPGGHIWTEHPFATPASERDPVRRFRGRLASTVTLWTAAAGDDVAGLTVISTLVAEPDRLLGIVGRDSDLREMAETSGRFVVTPLSRGDEVLADAFALVAPAPGGPFAAHDWEHSEWGPRLNGASTWVGCRVEDIRPVGYGALVEAVIEHAAVGDAGEPLLWHHGRYSGLG